MTVSKTFFLPFLTLSLSEFCIVGHLLYMYNSIFESIENKCLWFQLISFNKFLTTNLEHIDHIVVV